MRKNLSSLLLCLSTALVICVAPTLGQTPDPPPRLAPGERELKGGETHSFRIQLASGQFLHLLVEQEDIDVITASFGPDGKQLTESNSPNDRWGTEPILVIASVAGEYRVEVRSSNKKAPAGRYRINDRGFA